MFTRDSNWTFAGGDDNEIVQDGQPTKGGFRGGSEC